MRLTYYVVYISHRVLLHQQPLIPMNHLMHELFVPDDATHTVHSCLRMISYYLPNDVSVSITLAWSSEVKQHKFENR